MSKYKFIKSTYQMRDELYNLWDNFELLQFMEGYDYIMKREQEICNCLTTYGRNDFIEGCRIDYIVRQYS
jgi:hypothetical protein